MGRAERRDRAFYEARGNTIITNKLNYNNNNLCSKISFFGEKNRGCSAPCAPMDEPPLLECNIGIYRLSSSSSVSCLPSKSKTAVLEIPSRFGAATVANRDVISTAATTNISQLHIQGGNDILNVSNVFQKKCL